MRVSRRAAGLVVVLALLIAAAALGLILRSATPGPHWLRDAFHYKPPYVTAYSSSNAPGPYVPTASLSAVSAASRDDAWIIGSGPCCLNGEPGSSLGWHWNGATWRNVTLPRVGPADSWLELSSVAAADPTDAWAVGTLTRHGLAHDRAVIEHWNGKRWIVVRIPRLGLSSLSAVSSTDSRNVWAVGGTYADDRRYGKDHLWHHIPIPALTRALLLRWDGATWRRVSLPWARPGVTLARVVTTGPDSVWVITEGRYTKAEAVEYWNGKRWTEIPAPFGPADPI